MMSRPSELNAMVKSNFTNTWSGLIDLMKRRVACTAASQPPGTAMPGVKWDDSLTTARLFAHLAANLLHKYPIAMGLRPPECLLRAIKLPPKRISPTLGGHSPRSNRLVKSVTASANGDAPSPDLTSSNKCPGLNPSGPPADPDGKVQTASTTSSTVTCHAPVEDGSGSPSRASGLVSLGCFSRRSTRLSSSGVAIFPPSQRM